MGRLHHNASRRFPRKLVGNVLQLEGFQEESRAKSHDHGLLPEVLEVPLEPCPCCSDGVVSCDPYGLPGQAARQSVATVRVT